MNEDYLRLLSRMPICVCNSEKCHVCFESMWEATINAAIRKREKDIDDATKCWEETCRKIIADYREQQKKLVEERREKLSKTVTWNTKFALYAILKGDRIREPRTVEEILQCRVDPLNSKRIRLIIAAWKKENRHLADINTFTANDALQYLESEFGAPENGKFWPTIKMFATDEDTLHWDRSIASSSGVL